MKTLESALNGLAMRQSAIASNVANVDTPGYQAIRVSFEDQLQKALQPGSELKGAALAKGQMSLDGTPTDGSVQPVVEQIGAAFRNDGNSVDIDQEMVSLSDTTMRYDAVAQLLSKRLALMK